MEQLSWVASNKDIIHAQNSVILAVVYGLDGTSVADVTTGVAYSTTSGQMEVDYVSGSGVSDILPYMGLSTITLPIYAVFDLETAELLYYQDGNGTGPQGSITSINQANQ